MRILLSRSLIDISLSSINSMDGEALITPSKPDITPDTRLMDMALIPRYNVFIYNYNKPTCIVDNIKLQPLPTSTIHDNTFLALTDWKGKMLLIILLFLPILNCFLFLISFYCLIVYCKCLGIHEKNLQSVQDPFKNMVYDHDLCYKLRKDYYSFTIEFKQLEGFSLNYNRDIRKQMKLREERGKANFLIYNGNFWSSYQHFGKWKHKHIGFMGLSLGFAVASNLIFFLWIS